MSQLVAEVRPTPLLERTIVPATGMGDLGAVVLELMTTYSVPILGDGETTLTARRIFLSVGTDLKRIVANRGTPGPRPFDPSDYSPERIEADYALRHPEPTSSPLGNMGGASLG